MTARWDGLDGVGGAVRLARPLLMLEEDHGLTRLWRDNGMVEVSSRVKVSSWWKGACADVEIGACPGDENGLTRMAIGLWLRACNVCWRVQ